MSVASAAGLSTAANKVWITTFTGRTIHPFAPEVDDIYIEDIAHALAFTCRWAGHTSEYFSVAQHSVLVSLLCPVEWALEGLMHDASEAYLTDIPSPLKPHIPGYQELERRVEAAIAEGFSLVYPFDVSIKEADHAALTYEVSAFMPHKRLLEHFRVSKMTPTIDLLVSWPPEMAEAKFLDRYLTLQERKRNGN
jgi:hypothetical protein